MASRVTKAQLYVVAEYLSKIVKADFYIQYAYGSPRLMEMVDPKSGAVRDVSPRLPAGQLMQWMNAFEVGVVYATR